MEHLFAADGEYEMNLPSPLRGIWFIGIEHQSTLIVTLDGAKVYQTTIGGPEDERATGCHDATRLHLVQVLPQDDVPRAPRAGGC